jgi:hypothetical protein
MATQNANISETNVLKNVQWKRYFLIAMALVFILSIFFLTNKALTFTVIFILIGGLSKYFRTKFKIPVEVEPSFFLAVLSAHQFGWGYGMAVEMIPNLIINLFNLNIDIRDYVINIIRYSFIFWLVVLMQGFDILIVGVIIVFVRSIVSILLGLQMGIPISAFLPTPLNIMMAIGYFINLGRLLTHLMG